VTEEPFPTGAVKKITTRKTKQNKQTNKNRNPG